MPEVVQYSWPVLLDPPGAIDVGNNSYRIGNGPIIARSFRTTVAHVGTMPDPNPYNTAASMYSDGTVRGPGMVILDDLLRKGQVLQLGGGFTSRDAPRNPDGTPFQWDRTAALKAAGIPQAVADSYAKAGIDILTQAIPTNTGEPLRWGPYRGLFPDAQGGTTLLDANGMVVVRNFDEVAYIKAYSPVQFDASGAQIATTARAIDYLTYAPAQPVVANMVQADDTFGTSPTIDNVPSTGGFAPVKPLPAPNLAVSGASGGRDAMGDPTDVPMNALAQATTVAPAAKWKDETVTWIALAIVGLFAFGVARKGRNN